MGVFNEYVKSCVRYDEMYLLREKCINTSALVESTTHQLEAYGIWGKGL